MRRALVLHPDAPRATGVSVAAEVSRAGAALALRYVVTGALGGIRLPAPAAPERADRLWATTCLEAFIRARARAGYVEINLSPSTRWAAYRFDDYRTGMAALDIAPPRIATATGPDRLTLDAAVDLSGAADLPADAPWRIGLAAVIEGASGAKSYWALAHPPGKPDFHHGDGFSLELP